MAESIPYREIRKLVEKYDEKLLATDKRFRKAVQIIHEEGTTLFFENAFLMKKTVKYDKGETVWIIIFTEHHGFHIYHKDDLYSYFEYERRFQEPKELKTRCTKELR